MKRTVIALLFTALLAFGCATTNPCAPLIDKPILLENVIINMIAYHVKIQDVDEDGEADTLVVYVKKQGTDELVEYFRRPLTDEEKGQVKHRLEEKKFEEQRREPN